MVKAGDKTYSFKIDDFRRHCMLNGLDSIGLTLQHEAAISDLNASCRHLWINLWARSFDRAFYFIAEKIAISRTKTNFNVLIVRPYRHPALPPKEGIPLSSPSPALFMYFSHHCKPNKARVFNIKI